MNPLDSLGLMLCDLRVEKARDWEAKAKDAYTLFKSEGLLNKNNSDIIIRDCMDLHEMFTDAFEALLLRINTQQCPLDLEVKKELDIFLVALEALEMPGKEYFKRQEDPTAIK